MSKTVILLVGLILIAVFGMADALFKASQRRREIETYLLAGQILQSIDHAEKKVSEKIELEWHNGHVWLVADKGMRFKHHHNCPACAIAEVEEKIKLQPLRLEVER